MYRQQNRLPDKLKVWLAHLCGSSEPLQPRNLEADGIAVSQQYDTNRALQLRWNWSFHSCFKFAEP